MRFQSRTLQGSGLAVLLIGIAHAQTVGAIQTPQISVPLSDVKLDTPQGRRVAEARIRLAAEQVCTPAPFGPATALRPEDFEACSQTALREAKERLRAAESSRRATPQRNRLP